MTEERGASEGRAGTPYRRLFSLPALVAFAVAVAFLAFLVTRFDVDLAATYRQVRAGDPLLYALAFVSYYAGFVVRGARWRLTAKHAGISRPGQRLPSLWECSLLTLIGWFANSVGWLRAGDAYRAYAFSGAARSSFSWSLGVLVADRVLDVAAMVVLLWVAALALLATGGGVPSLFFGVIGLALAGAAAAGVAVMAWRGNPLLRWLPRPLSRAYEGLRQGALGSLRPMPGAMALGMGAWLLEAGRLLLVIHALGLSLDAPGGALRRRGERPAHQRPRHARRPWHRRAGHRRAARPVAVAGRCGGRGRARSLRELPQRRGPGRPGLRLLDVPAAP